MKTRIIILFLGSLLIGFAAQADDEVMRLFDQARQLGRQIKKNQIQFLIQKDPELKGFSVAQFDKPESAEIRDRIAFEFLWRKGELRNIWNSYVSGTRDMLSEPEQKELNDAHPEFAELEKKELHGPSPTIEITKEQEAEARKKIQTLFTADAKYRKELNELSLPLQQQIQEIEHKIVELHLQRKK